MTQVLLSSFLLLLLLSSLAVRGTMINRELELKLNTEMAIDFEGFEAEYYDCPAGYKSVGHGRNVEVFPLLEDEPYPMTIEYSKQWTYERLAYVRKSLVIWAPWLVEVPLEIRIIFTDMAFNMGTSKFMKFVKMIKAVKAADWILAAEELKDSNYYNQTGRRAKQHYTTLKNLGEV